MGLLVIQMIFMGFKWFPRFLWVFTGSFGLPRETRGNAALGTK